MVHYGALWDITRVWGPALKVLMTLSKSGHIRAAPPLPFSPSYVPPLSLVCHSPAHQSFPHVVHSQEAARITLQMHVPTGSRTSSGSHFNLSDSWQKMERKDFWLQSEVLSYFIHVLCPLGLCWPLRYIFQHIWVTGWVLQLVFLYVICLTPFYQSTFLFLKIQPATHLQET